MHDCSSIYRVPLLLQEQGVLEFFLERLKITSLETQHSYLHKWRNLADRCVCVCVCVSGVILISQNCLLLVCDTPSLPLLGCTIFLYL